MEAGKRIFIGLLFLFAIGIGIFTFAKNITGIHDIRLAGVEVKGRFPKISMKSFWAGEFQTQLNEWISTNVGLRGALIRLDNQINFSFFNEISSKYESKIILGKDRWLYEKGYVASLNHRDEVPQTLLEGKVRSLKKLQELLASNGIHFLFLITPSKATIYPEYIEDKYIIPKNSAKESNYEKLVPLLQEYGVQYLDGHQYLLELKKRGPYPVYPSSGTHWSFYSSCYFTLELISTLESLTKQKMGRFQVDRIQIINRPFSSDKDLASLANILFEKSLYGKEYYYPETSSSVSAENVFRPRMLFVGGSYLVALFYYLEKYQVYSERDFYYYYKQNMKYPSNAFNYIDRKNLDLKKEILEKDIVVVETNETGLPELGYGFVEDALKALGKKSRQNQRAADRDTPAALSNASTYIDTVQKIFIGYYHRPAGPSGLVYWAARLDATGDSLNEIIEAFANSAESQALYGPINSGNISSVVTSIYWALFNRAPVQAGLDYYVNGFNTGRFTTATIMLNVLDGAQNQDLQSVNNKVTASNLFTRTIDPDLDGANFQATYSGDTDAQKARNWLSTVTWNPATIPTQAQVTLFIKNNIADPGDRILSP